MTDIQTIVKQLGKLSADLDEAVTKLGEYEEIAVDAEGDYKKAFAEAFKKATGSVEDRKQWATYQTDKLYRTAGKAAAVVRRQREHLRALHARIDVGRTISSSVKAEMQLAGMHS